MPATHTGVDVVESTDGDLTVGRAHPALQFRNVGCESGTAPLGDGKQRGEEQKVKRVAQQRTQRPRLHKEFY